MLINRVHDLVSDAPDVDLQRANELIARALAVSPNSAWAHYVKGQVLRAQSRLEDAAIEYETAIAFDRNLANAYAWLGSCKLYTGLVDEVIPPTEYAIRLSPRDRNLADFCWLIGAGLALFESKCLAGCFIAASDKPPGVPAAAPSRQRHRPADPKARQVMQPRLDGSRRHFCRCPAGFSGFLPIIRRRLRWRVWVLRARLVPTIWTASRLTPACPPARLFSLPGAGPRRRDCFAALAMTRP
jgi:hypothetical protein